MGPKDEPVLFTKPYGQIFEILVRHLDHRATGLAKEVLMKLLCEVIDGASMPEVNMIDYASQFQGLQRAIDGGQMNVRLSFLDRGSEVTCAHMPLRFDEVRKQGSPRRGDPQAFLTQCADDLVQGPGFAVLSPVTWACCCRSRFVAQDRGRTSVSKR